MAVYDTNRLKFQDNFLKFFEYRLCLQQLNTSQGVTYTGYLPKQLKALHSCQEGDCLVVLPTGYGKTLIFHVLPYVTSKTVLIVSPLNAILTEQCEKFGNEAIHIDELGIQLLQSSNHFVWTQYGPWDAKMIKAIDCVIRLKSGSAKYILGHPEHVLQDQVKKILSKKWKNKISHVAVDEAHCVVKWGKSRFRPAYLDIKSLKAILPGVHFLGLTATASPLAQKEIKQSLLMTNCKLVALPPDRPNVFLKVHKRPPVSGGSYSAENSVEFVVRPLLQKLKKEGRDYSKTIVYLPLHWSGWAHDMAQRQFGLLPTNTGDVSPVAQYHAPQTDEMKEAISKDMRLPDGNLRLLFATEAYGMGADSPNIRRVIHVGPPASIETFVQEIGRAGRDGLPAVSELFYNASDLGTNREHVTDEIRSYCRLTTCRRNFLSQCFGFEDSDTEISAHNCCDNCLTNCTCSICEDSIMDGDDDTLVENLVLKEAPAQTQQMAKYVLSLFFEEENSLHAEKYAVPEMQTGLSVQLCDRLSKFATTYQSISRLEMEYPSLDKLYIENISQLLTDVVSCTI